MAPGRTAFTRTRGARSAAIRRVSCAIAALVRLWASVPRTAFLPATEPMFTITPPPALEHVGHGEAAELERHRDVEVERVLELLDPRVEEGPRHRAARVVHHDVDAAELGDGAVDEPRDHAEVVHVAGEHVGPPAPVADGPGHVLEVGRRAGRQGHVGAGGRVEPGDGRPDPLAGAGDHGDLAVEAEQVRRPVGRHAPPPWRFASA